VAIELDIIRVYDNNLRGVYTIRAIAQRLGLAYPYVHRTVHKLLDLGVLRTVHVGRSHCLSLDLRNRRAILYLTELELRKRAALPESVQAVAQQLDRDGTLAIETVIYGNNQLYLVGKGAFPSAKTVTRDELKELLLTTELFKTHTILHGYERFFTFLASIQPSLDEAYNPLVTVQ
jgi:DNA-binding Lrp family transcriptional regulator